MKAIHYLIFLLAGLLGLFVSAILIIFTGSIITSVFVFAVLGFLTGFFFTEYEWKSGIWVSGAYSLFVVYILLNHFLRNNQYDGVFWHNEFSIVAFYLYLSPILASCLGAYTASKISFYRIALSTLMIISAFLGQIYIISKNQPVVKTAFFSFNLIENENVQLKAEVKCEYTVIKDYLRFRNTDRGDCHQAKIFVVRKNPIYSLSINSYWTINGVEQFSSIGPVNGPNDTSVIDYSRSTNFDDIPVWITEIPSEQIAKARQVNFRWGEITIEFGESEFKNFHDLAEKYKQLKDK